MNTNHKLIRWNFITAGGIDGFSRFVVFLKCINNNNAETIFTCFRSRILEYGTPLRVRSDQGLENFKIAEFMAESKGLDNSSMIVGKSTHNQRIERLWRDVFECVLSFFMTCSTSWKIKAFLIHSVTLTFMHFIMCTPRKLTTTCRCGVMHGINTGLEQ